MANALSYFNCCPTVTRAVVNRMDCEDYGFWKSWQIFFVQQCYDDKYILFATRYYCSISSLAVPCVHHKYTFGNIDVLNCIQGLLSRTAAICCYNRNHTYF